MKVLIVVLIVCAAVAAGCARGAKAVIGAEKAVVGAGKVAGAEAHAAQTARGRALVASHTSELNESDSWTVVGAACTANDLMDLQEAPDFATAVEQAWITFGGYQTLYYRILELAEDLRAESSQWERQQDIGVFVVCESV